MSVLITIDPGLDYVVACVWDTTGWRGTPLLAECARRFGRLHELRTQPAHPLAHRLRQIADWMRCEVLLRHGGFGAILLEIERPTKAGTYRRNRANATTGDGFMPATMEGLNMAIGALVAAAPVGVTVELTPASSVPKPQRRALVDGVLPQLRGRNADIHDAAFMGLVTLSSWAPSPAAALTPR